MKPILAAVVALAACGDGAASPVDGVGNPDASGPLARITVYDWLGVPEDRAPVAVESPRGLVELFLTDAAGEASFRVVPGSRVWVVRRPSVIEQRPIRVDVVEGVDPGDVIGIGAPARFEVGGHLSVMFTPIDEADFYYLTSQLSGCLIQQDVSPEKFVFVDVYGRCAVEPREAVIEALDGSTFLPVGYLRVPHLIPSAAPQVIDGPFEPGTDYDLELDGLPPDAQWVEATVYSPAAWNYVGAFGSPVKAGAVTVHGTGPTLPTPLGVRVVSYQGISTHTVYEPLATLPTAAQLDLELLPVISEVTFDRDRLAVEWSANPGVLAPELVIGTVATSATAWTIYAPGDHTAVVLHDPPAELGITTDLVGPVQVGVTLVHAGASFKAHLADADRYLENPFTNADLPATQVTLSSASTPL